MSVGLMGELAAGLLIALAFGYVLIGVGKYLFGATRSRVFATIGVVGAGLSGVISIDRGALVTLVPPLLAAAFFLWRYWGKGGKGPGAGGEPTPKA